MCTHIGSTSYRLLQGMWAYILPELLKAIDAEPEAEVQVELLNSLAKVQINRIINGVSDTQEAEKCTESISLIHLFTCSRYAGKLF